ncbi:MAG: response regulator [Nitrospiraceae bacterium]|nr:response regulator [Nitrospiraceae bacterium]
MNRLYANTVLVVDDDYFVLESVCMILKEAGYNVKSAFSAIEALDMIKADAPDIVLTDIRMPGMNGIELLERVHASEPNLPVLLMTAFAEMDVAVDAVKKGAFDLILKPYKPEYMIHAVSKAARYCRLLDMERTYKSNLEETVRQRTKDLNAALTQLRKMSYELLSKLTTVAEYRDTDTGMHTSRIGVFSAEIAKEIGMSSEFVDVIRYASAMHDIGKVGISDNILLKPGALTKEEFEIMKTHCEKGWNMLHDTEFDMIKTAASIALNHHERWDGTGYPNGLKGDSTPVEGRIVMLSDQYEALRSARPYKRGFTHVETCKIINEGDGRTMPGHFDPDVLKAFKKNEAAFEEIYKKLAEE